ncbi:thermonuclease family protein [Terribacillus halophilus]|jgi:micrococcal nuclease|uniref:thermonuclease family protein n=1 Tax=Terribacillus halophilus TaxID=361279 RepID=UPI000987B88B|nr:thermonuclease family protein [Terribacillus halophilus]
MKQTLQLTVWLITTLFLLSACGTVNLNQAAETNDHPTATSGTTDKVEVSLIRIVDGDTIKVNYNGQEETVRYLLIDTPETKAPNKCVQPYGKNASKRNEELVTNGKLELEFDVGQRKDKYGRLLAYVYADGQSVQETLLTEGLARVAYVYPPNTRYLDSFEDAEASAIDGNKAVWRQNGYATDKGFNGCSIEEKEDNVSSDVDQDQSDEATDFANCTALRETYPAGVPSTHPAYQPKFDRDKDNYACE